MRCDDVTLSKAWLASTAPRLLMAETTTMTTKMLLHLVLTQVTYY
jgi:hypothetical protein